MYCWWKSSRTSKIEEPVKIDFITCVRDCIIRRLGPTRWAEIFDKCRTDVRCYIREAGSSGLACAAECILNDKVVEEPVKVDFITCVRDCIIRKLGPARWLEIFDKCRTDVRCYIREAGSAGLACAAECIADEKMEGDCSAKVLDAIHHYKNLDDNQREFFQKDIENKIRTKHPESPNLHVVYFVHFLLKSEYSEDKVCQYYKVLFEDETEKCKICACALKCLGSGWNIFKVAALVARCKVSVPCYAATVGAQAAQCIAKCL